MFLIPLILLIPINRTVKIIAIEQKTGNAITQTTTEFYYPEIGTFGKKAYITQKNKTDNSGEVIFKGIKEPLWYVILDRFLNYTASVKIASQCGISDAIENQYHTFPRFGYKTIEIPEQIIELTITVIDTETKKPIENAKVEINNTDSLFSNADGNIVLTVPKCSNITLIGSKEDYINDTLTNNVETLINMPDSARTLPLQPVFKGEGGDLRFNLQWYSTTDLDLHVIDPCGHEIFYKSGHFECGEGVGTLDVDANAKYDDKPSVFTTEPQENIFFVNPQKGEYIVKVVCFRKNESGAEEFNLTIIDNKGRKDFSGKVKHRETVKVTTYTIE